MRGNNILILVVAIILGGIAAFLARNWLLSRQGAVSAGTTIVVAAKELPFGTRLTRDNVKVIPWAAHTLPNGAFVSEQQLFKGGQRTVLRTLEAGEPVLNAKITGPGQRASLSTLLDKDKRAITIRVDDVRGVAGFILPNDHVDVVLIHSDNSTGNGRQEYSDILLQDVKVIAVDQIASERKDRPVVAKAVTLEVTPRQAQKISLATNVGRLSLILRKAGDSKIIADRRVSRTDLTRNDFSAAQTPQPAPALVKEAPIMKEKPVKEEKEAAKAPAPAVDEPAPRPPVGPKLSTVSIVRGVKNTQEYQVIREGN